MQIASRLFTETQIMTMNHELTMKSSESSRDKCEDIYLTARAETELKLNWIWNWFISKSKSEKWKIQGFEMTMGLIYKR